MALAVFPGERLYKVFLSTHEEADDIMEYTCRFVSMTMPDGNIRAITQFIVRGVEARQSSIMPKTEVDSIIDFLADQLGKAGCSGDVYDFSEAESVDRQLELMKGIKGLSDLANVIEKRRRWIKI